MPRDGTAEDRQPTIDESRDRSDLVFATDEFE
jgi:hypothetical protein